MGQEAEETVPLAGEGAMLPTALCLDTVLPLMSYDLSQPLINLTNSYLFMAGKQKCC